MKRIFNTLLAIAAIALSATTADAQIFTKKFFQGRQESTHYLQGAVPEVGGKVQFDHTFSVEGRSSSDIVRGIAQWASLRYAASTEKGIWTDADYFKNTAYASLLEYEPEKGILVCRGNEEMVFTNKTLAKDYTIIEYVLRINVSGTQVKTSISNIVYTYQLTEQPTRIPAEDWITDKEAISKKGELYRNSARFRVKTVDFAAEIFSEIEAAAKQ